jgi:hypothetical protein
MENNKFVYVIYISATPKKVWTALTDPKLTAKYWQHVNLSDWITGLQMGAPALRKRKNSRHDRKGSES